MESQLHSSGLSCYWIHAVLEPITAGNVHASAFAEEPIYTCGAVTYSDAGLASSSPEMPWSRFESCIQVAFQKCLGHDLKAIFRLLSTSSANFSGGKLEGNRRFGP